jgi:hypothetical protein
MLRHLPVAALLLSSLTLAALATGPAYTDSDKTDIYFPFQGEYIASVSIDNSQARKGLQVVALGGGKFRVTTYEGGLPGDGWNKAQRHEADAVLKDETLLIAGELSLSKAIDGKSILARKDGAEIAKLTKVARTSPTLGAKPPAGAVVLFDGKSADAFQNGKVTDDGLLIAGCTSKQKFGSCRVHIEFRLPYMPEDRGQARGNSGIYLQGRYEVQMLDSFGLEGKNNECGGLYELKDPDVNMCLPPLAWQTYDIAYTAARYDGDKVVAPPRITVEHNGVVIHQDVELPADRGTRAAPVKPGPEPGPIYLQDHGNPVRYRNIWVVDKN